MFDFLSLATGQVIQRWTDVVCRRFTDRVENQRQRCKKEQRTKVRSWVSIRGGEGSRIRIVNCVPVNTVYERQRLQNVLMEDELRKNVAKGEGRLQITIFHRSLRCSQWRTEPCCVLVPKQSVLGEPLRWGAWPLCIFITQKIFRNQHTQRIKTAKRWNRESD